MKKNKRIAKIVPLAKHRQPQLEKNATAAYLAVTKINKNKRIAMRVLLDGLLCRVVLVVRPAPLGNIVLLTIR
jgi:antitoxin (DNA-binding transcriptional repressor) of toxin-antitoxin stability system